ncbi:MAG: hypothetical protein IKJ44_01710 [Elusimicrobiaceae bacterium]|nr:hypothetical protein [Elusimicrobiaceae bacterium]
MKTFIRLALCAFICLGFTACASKNAQKDDTTYYRKKIYLTEQDYLDDLEKDAYKERREAKPNTESNYIFEVQPETQKNVYFFDDRTRPMVPGEPGEREYKNTKRLWERPRRYSPEQYYGGQPAGGDTAATDYSTESYSSDYSDY